MKIMVVEDDPVSRRVLENLLKRWGYSTVSAVNGSEAWELIQRPEAPNLVISDWMMPNMDGIELCEKIRHIERTGYIYFILLTTKADRKDLIYGFESGADDFITKPFDNEELHLRIKIGERIINLEQKIINLANTDYLTGALNRRAFMERLADEIDRGLRHKKELSVIIADVDHFKDVNDSYGHQVGDLVLKKIAGILSDISRSYDFVGRYGGEEFIVCLPETSTEQAGIIAERMRGKLASLKMGLFDNRSETVSVTASFGVTSLKVNHAPRIDSIIKKADEALYIAKSKGRDRVCLSDFEVEIIITGAGNGNCNSG